MTTYHEIIRQRAREAARQAARHDHEWDDDVRAEEAADAASDVWSIHVDRLMGALTAAGVSPALVEAIAYDGITAEEGIRREVITDLTAKVQLLVDHLASHGLLEDGCFTFPDGVTWGVSE